MKPTLWALIAARRSVAPGLLLDQRLAPSRGLDRPVRLLAGKQPTPDLVNHLAVDRLDQRALDRLALQRAVDRLLDQRSLQDADEGALHGLAFDRRGHCRPRRARD